ncbi:aspartate 1-decarboxylase autocleavage activator PanM [Buttiauxella warmboldiae]|uniref:PanD regulatory factor n=1 Tax=Buttiauxella warmboldiae TaxID=82993 RepID=A0A3N5DMI6_9ENTR|nr:aspartate 1-decarboxylase autocleavage activator PanM [Buttiauxella warmboldiae]RPH28867.1 aspartate 1-decarboxylase autocleavage activator PanM [Buttiauxella warmboldiae]
MKLTIIRLLECSAQDEIDLAKIWPEYFSTSLMLSDAHRIYAAKFNDRLLGAVRVTLAGSEATLDSLRVREITRRRGVGQYLVEEVIRDNPDITGWQMPNDGVEDIGVMNAFMQAVGFEVQSNGWKK